MIIAPAATPALRHTKRSETTVLDDERIVRFYRRDPEGFTLQIWKGRSYMSIYLTNEETFRFIDGILKEIAR